MATLAANTTLRYDPVSNPIERIFKTGAITDEFYIGAFACCTAGLILVTNADATEFMGIVTERKSLTGTASTVKAYLSGVFWAANTNFTDANYGVAFACTAASDNPADLVTLGAGTTGQVGTLVHVDSTAVSGWIDISIGARGPRGTNS